MNKIIGILLLLFVAASCKEEAEPIVKISTNYGDMRIRLYEGTPKHRDNFMKLVKENFYDSLLFHRVIDHFMIQGGDPTSKNAAPDVMLGEGDVGYRVDAEFQLPKYFHKKGALAAAREGDQVNPERASSGAQFYIVQGRVYEPEELATVEKVTQACDSLFVNEELVLTEEQKKAYTTVGGTPHLDGQYTVFGEVIEGLDVLDKIAAVNTGRADRPVKDVVIYSVRKE